MNLVTRVWFSTSILETQGLTLLGEKITWSDFHLLPSLTSSNSNRYHVLIVYYRLDHTLGTLCT